VLTITLNTPETHLGQKQWYHAVEKTLRREVKEEVNLIIGKTEYLLDIALIRPDGVPVIILSFLRRMFRVR
jgi:8-oxo-dGTP pyrophosphatase MutT (NUDIX family)